MGVRGGQIERFCGCKGRGYGESLWGGQMERVYGCKGRGYETDGVGLWV